MKKFMLSMVFCFIATSLYADTLNYNTNVFYLGKGQKNYKCHGAHINYKDESGKFQPIDTRLAFKDGTWKHNKASYHPTIPEYSDEWFEFYNAYEGANHTIKARPITAHIKGIYFEGQEDGHFVLYKDAFGKGIDLKVYSYHGGLKKVICINEKPADVSKDLTFDFEMQFPAPSKDKIKDNNGNEWDKQAKLDFKDKTIKIGETGKESYFRNARLWDSGEINQPVDIQLYVSGGKTYLRKTITKDILEKAVYPLYTDHPTSYYAGAGDGHTGIAIGSTHWAAAHDATSGDYTDYTGTVCSAEAFVGATGHVELLRVFTPIDTSGIDDGATISGATLNLYVTAKTNTDDDGDDWINIVQTFQADPTVIGDSDYEDCGSDNGTAARAKYAPVEGATRIDIGNITALQYNVWTLNATGIGWIKKTAGDPYTMLGVREGHDCINSTIVGTKNNAMNFSSSEDTSGTKDPYLDVTVSGGATAKPTHHFFNSYDQAQRF
jgi:hypothetical protein